MTQALPVPLLRSPARPKISYGLWSDEPPLESDLHREQIDSLIRLIRWLFRPGTDRTRNDVYVAGNLTIYYSPNQKKSEFFRGPDVFVVLGVDPEPRRSWTVWEEDDRYPNVIIEMLSSSTAEVDRTEKKSIYQSIWRVPEYFWFDPYSLEFKGFSLVEGVYQPIAPTPEGWLWSEELDVYLGIADDRLRLITPDGEVLPLPEEAAQTQADREQLRAERAEAKLARWAEKLRELGVDPERLE
jgi:Uma2 family endonuclease